MKRAELVRLIRRRHNIPLHFVRSAKGSHEIWGAYGVTVLIPRVVRHPASAIHKLVAHF